MEILDKQGLYLNGKLIADGYLESIKEIYQLENVPAGFCVNSAYEAVVILLLMLMEFNIFTNYLHMNFIIT